MQSERYDLFKRAKLRKESLRRIVNHALSQSVPASVVTTVNGFTKVFAGEIIEKARTVQAEWADAYDQASRAAFEAEEAAAQTKAAATSSKAAATTSAPGSGSASLNNGVKKESPSQDRTTPSAAPAHNSASPPPSSSSPAPKNTGAADSSASPAPVRPQREFRPPPNPHRGQLLPSHLREALRRTKRDGEDGGVGFSGLSMENLGVRGAFTWNSGSVGGRRLFR
jgi:transcription initiation factor TFIID subunit 11